MPLSDIDEFGCWADPTKPPTLIEFEESSIYGELMMAKARLAIAQETYDEAVDEGWNVHKIRLPKRRKE